MVYHDSVGVLSLCHAECLGSFVDFDSVEGDRVQDNNQYIIPELNFSCDGNVTQWKVGIESAGNNQEVNLQVWRPGSAGEYSLVNEVTYTKTDNERIATVPVSMSVMAGDMVGFNGRLQLHTLPDVGLTMFSQRVEPVTSLNNQDLDPTVGPSPYITVMFGECLCTYTLLQLGYLKLHAIELHNTNGNN